MGCNFGAAAQDAKTYTTTRPTHAKQTPYEPKYGLDSALVLPDGGRKFDKQIWANDPSQRLSMLFDLYHSFVRKVSLDELYKLLGQPDDTSREGTESYSAYYSLGKQNGLATYLLVYSDGKTVKAFFIEQRSDIGFREHDTYPEWQRTNLTWEDAAIEYNKYYHLVGIPVPLILSAILCPESTTTNPKDCNPATHVFFPFEFEYTPDQKRVAKMRMAYVKPDGTKAYTAWLDKDWRQDSRCLKTQYDYFAMEQNRSIFLGALGSFNKADWMWDTGKRVGQVNCLARSYPLIGMTRSEIHDLLGEPAFKSTEEMPSVSNGREYRPYEGQYMDLRLRSPKGADTDKYLLSAHPCGNVGREMLEFLYEKNRVVAYRVFHRGGTGYGLSPTHKGSCFEIPAKMLN